MRGMTRKRGFAFLLCLLLFVDMMIVYKPIQVKAAGHELDVTYSGHMQTYGNLPQVKNGETLGKIPSDKRLEAITINSQATLTYQAHVQTYGWQPWKTNGQMAGTTGKSKRLEAIRIKLTGKWAEEYDVYYRSHLSGGAWLGWSKNGEISGSVGYGSKLDGIQIRIVSKDYTAPPSVDYTYVDANDGCGVAYSGHVQTYGDLPTVYNGASLGTTGKSKRIEAIKLSLVNNKIPGGLSYRVHCQTYGWMPYCTENQQAGTTGQSKRLEAIEISLTGEIAKYYDIYYRVHIQSYGWLDWAKNGAPAGSAGRSKRMEAIQVKLVAKGGSAPGVTATPFIEAPFKNVGANRVVKGIGEVDLWVGDSRFVAFGGAIYGYSVGTESYYPNLIARVSANYQWLNSKGYSLIAARLRQKPDAVVVFNLGLNDIANYENYNMVYKRLHAEFPRATLCFMSVNPIGPNFRYSNNYGLYKHFTTCVEIFNAYFREHVADFDGYYIDTYYNCNLPTLGDGIHHSNATCQTIYKYVTGK